MMLVDWRHKLDDRNFFHPASVSSPLAVAGKGLAFS